MNLNGFTRTEQRMVEILEDGKRHTREELLESCRDELASMDTLYVHISNIRRKIPAGQDILCVFRERRMHYQWVRLLHSPNDGRT